MIRTITALAFALLLAVVPALADEPPADWTATVLDSFDSLPLKVSAPVTAASPAIYSQFKLTPAKDAKVAGASLLWQVTAQPGMAEAALLVGDEITACDGVAVWVKNPAAHELNLALRLTDASGETWNGRPVALEGRKNWFQYVLKVAEMSGSVGKYPIAPFRTMELILSGLQSGKPYALYLDELRTLTAPPPDVTISNVVIPNEINAGKPLPVRATLRFSGRSGAQVQVDLRLSREGIPVSHAQTSVLADNAQPLQQDLVLPIPAHIASGTYEVRLSCLGATPAAVPEQEVQVAGVPSPVKVTVWRPAQGGCLVVDGKPLPIIGGWFCGEQMPRQAPWVMFPVTCSFDPTAQAAAVWLGPDTFDFSRLDARIAQLLSLNPDAYLIPVVQICSPPWWDKAHPKELMVYGDGKTTLPVSVEGTKRSYASWASALWRKDASAALARLIEHLQQSPAAPAIIGYQLASGEDGRWVYPGATKGVLADYSYSQQTAFQAWLKNKYQTVTALRVAWGQPSNPVKSPEALKEIQPIMGWNQARIPAQARRLLAPTGVLHDPSAMQDVIDYNTFCSDLVAETIRYFAQVVRTATQETKLVGVSYGQLFDLAASRAGLQNGGQLAISPIIQAPELDFITSPGTSDLTGATPVQTTFAASLADHDKLWIATAPQKPGLAATVTALGGGGVVAQSGYDPQAWPAQVRGLPPDLGRSSVSEIAVIVDDISAAYTSCTSELAKPLLSDQRVSLSLLGAPYDVWTLDDVIAGRVTGYKLYLFLDAFYFDAKSRQQLVDVLNNEQAMIVWVYAPGAIDTGLGGRTMKELTGLTFARPMRRLPRTGKETDAEADAARSDVGLLQVKVGEAGGYSYGSPVAVTPRFACVDDQADIRGTLAGTDLGGLAVKQSGDLKMVWSAAPHLPAGLLRGLATEAGVHVYTDPGDAVWVGTHVLALRAGADGEHGVRLPKLAQVYDLATGQPLGQKATGFKVTLKAGQIGLYYYGDSPLVDR